MNVSVTNHYTDETKTYTGPDAVVEHQLLADYPWLKEAVEGDLRDYLEYLDSNQAYSVEAEGLDGDREDDEVSRMLKHPNPAERSMALKLGTLKSHHLDQAALDPEPEVYGQAINHPNFDHEAGMRLMNADDANEQKLAFLAEPHRVTPKHLEALYQFSADDYDDEVQGAIANHPALDQNLARALYSDPRVSHQNLLALMEHSVVPEDVLRSAAHPSNRPDIIKKAIEHPGFPRDTAEQIVKSAVGSHDPQLSDLACHVLVYQPMSPDVIRGVLSVCKTIPGQLSADLRIAACSGPGALPGHIDELLTDRNPDVLIAASRLPNLTATNLHTLLQRARTTGNKDLLRAALSHTNVGSEHLESLVEQPLGKSETDNLQDVSQVAQDMLGFQPHLNESFQAAKYLAGGQDVPFEMMRRALWQYDGDNDTAALVAFGFEPDASHLAALRAVKTLESVAKSEVTYETAETVVAVAAEGADCADGVRRAFADHFVYAVKMGGKHSHGSMLARDDEGGETWLLKPGSGQSPASGATDDPSSQSAREAAFFHVAQDWGLSAYFPRAELLLVDDKEFAAIHLLPWSFKSLEGERQKEPSLPRKVLHKYLTDGTLHKWAAIDAVLGNPDRHLGNCMVSTKPARGKLTTDSSYAAPDDHQDEVREVRLIDHGSAFAGFGFDPAHDKNSFVPGYLRAWAPTRFNSLEPGEKFGYLPRVNDTIAHEVGVWFVELSEAHLARTLHQYGIDPAPSLSRLATLKKELESSPIDVVLNRFWASDDGR